MAKRRKGKKVGGAKRVQAPAPPGARGRLDRRWLVAMAVVALVIVGVLVAVSIVTARSDSSSAGGSPGASGSGTGPAVSGGVDVRRLLTGIPQSGATLGRPDAPVTLVEYADPQCPYCAQFSLDAFPGLVRDYVRPGKVKLVFRGIPIIGPDSVKGLQTVFAAGQQNKLWNLLEILYLNQGRENSGWLDESFLRSAGGAVPGLDVQKMVDASGSDAVKQAMDASIQAARRGGVRGTPSFEAGRTGGTLEPIAPSALTEEAMAAKLDPLLGQ